MCVCARVCVCECLNVQGKNSWFGQWRIPDHQSTAIMTNLPSSASWQTHHYHFSCQHLVKIPSERESEESVSHTLISKARTLINTILDSRVTSVWHNFSYMLIINGRFGDWLFDKSPLETLIVQLYATGHGAGVRLWISPHVFLGLALM